MPVNLQRTFSSQCSVIETTDTNIHIMLPHNIKLYQAFYKIQSFVERLFMSMLVKKQHGGVH